MIWFLLGVLYVIVGLIVIWLRMDFTIDYEGITVIALIILLVFWLPFIVIALILDFVKWLKMKTVRAKIKRALIAMEAK